MQNDLWRRWLAQSGDRRAPCIVATNASVIRSWLTHYDNDDGHVQLAASEMVAAQVDKVRQYTHELGSLEFAGEGQTNFIPMLRYVRILDTINSPSSAGSAGFRWDLAMDVANFPSSRQEERMLTPISSTAYRTGDAYNAFLPEAASNKPSKWHMLLAGCSLVFQAAGERVLAYNATDDTGNSSATAVGSNTSKAAPMDVQIKLSWYSQYGDAIGQFAHVRIFTDPWRPSALLLTPIWHTLGRAHFIPAVFSQRLCSDAGLPWNLHRAPALWVKRTDGLTERKEAGIAIEANLHPVHELEAFHEEAFSPGSRLADDLDLDLPDLSDDCEDPPAVICYDSQEGS